MPEAKGPGAAVVWDGSFHKRLSRFESFDEIRLHVVPRFKTSGLSGDEWRQHVQVDFLFKGEVVAESGFRDMQAALLLLGHLWITQQEPIPERVIEIEKLKCDQPSCRNDAVGKYEIKEQFSERGDKLDPKDMGKAWRQFCAVHANRGDCSREDSDANYTALNPEKLTPSMFTNTQESPSAVMFGTLDDLVKRRS